MRVCVYHVEKTWSNVSLTCFTVYSSERESCRMSKCGQFPFRDIAVFVVCYLLCDVLIDDNDDDAFCVLWLTLSVHSAAHRSRFLFDGVCLLVFDVVL